jgi:hypothetical protein
VAMPAPAPNADARHQRNVAATPGKNFVTPLS